MGRHREKKNAARYGMTPGMGGMGGMGALAALVPLLGLGVVIAIVFAMMRRKRMLRAAVCLPTCGVATGVAATNCATVGLNERLVAAERLPGVKYKEVDVITRKRIPLHEVREIYEGPAETEMFEGTQREYVAPDVGCATGVAGGYAGQVCTTNCTPVGGIATGGFATGGIATGGFATGGLATGAGRPIVHNRKIPLRERALAKVTGRPVVSNYH